MIEYFGSGRMLKSAIKKYGKVNFKREILEWCFSKNELNIREIYWIMYYNSNDQEFGYNFAKGGQGGKIVSSEYLSKCVKETQWTGERGDKRRQLHSERFSGAKNHASKKYKFIRPDGTEFVITCLSEFCKENNYSKSTIRGLVGRGIIQRTSIKDTSFYKNSIKRIFEGWEIICLDPDKNLHTQEMKILMRKNRIDHNTSFKPCSIIYDNGVEFQFKTKKYLDIHLNGVLSPHQITNLLHKRKEYNVNFKIQFI